MIWLFQQVWLWVVISAVFGFVATLVTVLERRPVVELGEALTTSAAAKGGRHSAQARAAAAAAAEVVADSEEPIGSSGQPEPRDVTIEPFDPATD